MAQLYNQLASISSLSAAWEKVRQNRGAPGADHQTIEDFSLGLSRNLAELNASLMNRTYRPGPIRKLSIPKKDGTQRLLSIPSVTDRVVQTSLAQALTPLLEPEMEEASYAYRPGRSVRMAVDRVSRYYREGYEWVVDGDIDDYFDTVPHKPLLRILARYVDDSEVLELVEQWLSGCASGAEGLPQGSPLSPLLANIYLDDIDERIKGKGVRLVRFADDFILLCKTQSAARDARQKMSGLLAEYGLRLHPDKTSIVSFNQGFSFLGHLFVRALAVKQTESRDGPEAPEQIDLPPQKPGPAATCKGGMEKGGYDTLPALPPKTDEAEGSGLSPRLRVLYVTGKGRWVDVRNQAFSVREGEDREAAELLAVMPHRLNRLELWPGASISHAAQHLALACGIQVAYVDHHGGTMGTLEPSLPQRAALHLAQARHALDGPERLNLARLLVRGRLRNQRALLRRLNRRRKDGDTSRHIEEINRILKRLDTAPGVRELMGLEGLAARHYWPALARQIDPAWGFTKRIRRPPGDPVNLVIGFTATMLHRDLACLIARHGLHPGFGTLHGSVNGRDGCASDMVEEFRAPLTEGLAVYLVNNRILKPEMFFSEPGRPCLTTRQGRELILRSFEAWLDRPIRSPRSGNRLKWRGLLEEQVLSLRDHFLGGKNYAPYAMDY